MDEKYSALRKQLNCLGYTQSFSYDSMALVERLTADIVQTTCSLQYYMNLSKEVLQQRDSWEGAAEPYKCDNAKLIKENNKLHLELLHSKEDLICKINDSKLKVKNLENEVSLLKEQNKNLKLQCREYQLRNICTKTISSSNKLVHTDPFKNRLGCQDLKICHACSQLRDEINQQSLELVSCRNEKSGLIEKINLIKCQLEQRDKEIQRLNMLLEGGRPLSVLRKECSHDKGDFQVVELRNKLAELENINANLSQQLNEALAKQHEAMRRAVHLTNKNQKLEKQLHITDEVALRVEEESNARLKEQDSVIDALHKQLKGSDDCHMKLKNIIELHDKCAKILKAKDNEIDVLRSALDENVGLKDIVMKENKELLMVNKRLRESDTRHSEPLSSNRKSDEYHYNVRNESSSIINEHKTCNENLSKEKLLKLLENERKFYENHLNDIKSKLNDKILESQQRALNSIDSVAYEKLKDERDFYFREYKNLKEKSPREEYVTELQNKISGLEQRIFQLLKENRVTSDSNRDLKMQLNQIIDGKQSYENSSHAHFMLEQLEKDLTIASNEIKNLEKERDQLYSKLRTAASSENDFKRLYEREIPYQVDVHNKRMLTIQQECDDLRDNLKTSESELLHMKTLYNQLKSLQVENDRNMSDVQSQLHDTRKELSMLRNSLSTVEKQKSDLEYELKLLKADKSALKESLSQLDRERDNLVMDADEKSEKLSTLQHHIRSKETSIELLENKIIELNRKLELSTSENATLEHKLRDMQTCSEALSLELDTITKQRDNALIENRRLQSDLAALTNDLRSLKREYDCSRKEVDEMKQQLQHYVDEVRRIEDILSRKEAERTEMLDHFASLSHEATVLESNNHSLENETASKNIQLQAVSDKLNDTERKLKSRESLVEMQEEKISSLIDKISNLESDLIKQRDAVKNAEQMLAHSQEMCMMLENQKKNILIGIGDNDTEKKNLEYDLKILSNEKRRLEDSLVKDKATVESLETLLSDSRREVVELKLSLQDCIEENHKLKRRIESLQKHIDMIENESLSSRQRTEEATKQLQDLQTQMTDERYQRVRSMNLKQKSDKFCSSGTL